MNATDIPSIHRHLDEAFAGIVMTAEVQDLKEEIRGNLSARVDELIAGGTDATTAVTTAVAELGDIRTLVASLEGATDPQSAARLNRVRQSPVFVIGETLLSFVLAASVALVIITALGVTPLAAGYIAGVTAACAVTLIVALGSRQETSAHYPLPRARAIAYGLWSGVGMLGLTGVVLFFVDPGQLWLLIGGIVVAVASLTAFIWLGVTQTNRTKPWALELRRASEADDAFSKNPALAARFGLYTVVIWILTFTAFIILSITVGFAWSWLALVGGFAVFFLTLAHMLYGAKK